jgi:hypothetical protein
VEDSNAGERMKAKIQLDWLPLPKEALEALELKEGDEVSLEVVGPDHLVIKKLHPQEKK